MPEKLFNWYITPNHWLEIILWKSENAKMTQNGLYSLNRNFWLQPYRSFQKSSRNLRGINYQMVHICWAPSRLKMSLTLIFLEQKLLARNYLRPCTTLSIMILYIVFLDNVTQRGSVHSKYNWSQIGTLRHTTWQKTAFWLISID